MNDKYFEDARTMFMSDGWSDFVNEVKELMNTCTLDACNTTEEFYLTKGKLAACRVILGYEDLVMASEAQDEDGE